MYNKLISFRMKYLILVVYGLIKFKKLFFDRICYGFMYFKCIKIFGFLRGFYELRVLI